MSDAAGASGPFDVHVGSIRKPHGIRGEVAASVSEDHAGFFESCPQVELELAGGERRRLDLESLRGTFDKAILAFEGIEDRSGADTLRGARIFAPRDKLRSFDPGAVLRSDLVGACVHTSDDTSFGVVAEVLAYPAGDVLVVERGEDSARGLVLFRVAGVEVGEDGRPTVTIDERDIAWQ